MKKTLKIDNKFSISEIPKHVFMLFYSLLCIIPILLVISISLSNDSDIRRYGYKLIPIKIDLSAFRFVFSDSEQILRSYGISILVCVIGTIASLWLTTTIAYVISRRDYAYRNITSFLVFFTMLFNGGLAATYIWYTKGLGLQDNIYALIVPGLIAPFNILLVKGFLQSVPFAIIESAKIDGCGEFKTFVRLILPLSKPGLATLSLFIILGYWNDWYTSLLYINNDKIVSLQYLLYKIIKSAEFMSSGMADPSIRRQMGDIPKISARMAMCLIAAGPMLVVFPFFQKYFVKGITIGSVKG